MAGDSRTSEIEARGSNETDKRLGQELAQAQARFAENPFSSARRRDLIEIHKSIGKRYLKHGDKQAALAHYEEMLMHYEGLCRHHKSQCEIEHEICICQIEVGDLRRALGDEVGALVAYGEALTICEKLVAKEPQNSSFQRALVIAKWRTAELDNPNNKRLLQNAHDHLLSLQGRGELEEEDIWMIDAIKEQLMANGPSCSVWQKVRSFFLPDA